MEMLVHPEAGRGGRVSVRGLLCARHQQQGEAGTARWQREDIPEGSGHRVRTTVSAASQRQTRGGAL